MFGLYEHELNGWLDAVLPQIDQILDVGANDGYFTFGCAAALQRLGKPVRILAFEPITSHVHQLMRARAESGFDDSSINIVQASVGRSVGTKTVILDQFAGNGKTRALIKVDVEGGELEVIAGARAWLNPTNFFLIEIHSAEGLVILQQEFADVSLKLRRIDQRPLPFLGRETRDVSNWWLVSDQQG
jgi:hypothetical protein